MHSQNFEHLRPSWPELASLGGFAEQYNHADPEGAVVKLRMFAENSVAVVYREHALPRAPQSGFMDHLANESFKTVTPAVGINASETLSNSNFRPHPALGAILIWFKTHGADSSVRNAAIMAAGLHHTWEANNQQTKRQLDLFDALGEGEG